MKLFSLPHYFLDLFSHGVNVKGADNRVHFQWDQVGSWDFRVASEGGSAALGIREVTCTGPYPYLRL